VVVELKQEMRQQLAAHRELLRSETEKVVSVVTANSRLVQKLSCSPDPACHRSELYGRWPEHSARSASHALLAWTVSGLCDGSMIRSNLQSLSGYGIW
jgi:hypothetical protein